MIDTWLLAQLACPRDRSPLSPGAAVLTCPHGHVYPVVDGVPVLLVDESTPTIDIAGSSLAAARAPERSGPLFLDTLSLSDDERRGIVELAGRGHRIDPVVAYLVGATNGMMYRHLIGVLTQYPIPSLPMPPGEGRTLLDIGCSWGRWTLAAAERGYRAVGIDPSLGAVMAARRAAAQLGRPGHYVVGDARHLPFAAGTFDTVFSYSVIQHFSYADAERSAEEVGRVLKSGGVATIQMPTRWGIRCLYHQARRRFREPRGFEVRYWTRRRLREVFGAKVGAVRLSVDCYFGIGLQASDAPLMPGALRAVVRASEALKAASRVLPPLAWVADSVFVNMTKPAAPRVPADR